MVIGQSHFSEAADSHASTELGEVTAQPHLTGSRSDHSPLGRPWPDQGRGAPPRTFVKTKNKKDYLQEQV